MLRPRVTLLTKLRLKGVAFTCGWCLLLPSSLFAFQVQQVEFQEKRYIIATVNLSQDKLRFFWKKHSPNPTISKSQSTKPLKFFENLAADLKKQKIDLIFAMNAGMYMEDFAPLGLYIEDFHTIKKLNLKSGHGNFYLKPNGVFFIDENDNPFVKDAVDMSSHKTQIKWATQSGPLLVHEKNIHPKFQKNSKNKLIRNAVGVDPDGIISLVISKDAVNFHELAILFRDHLHCNNALYLDGNVSQIYSKDLKRYDREIAVGPMIGIIKPQSAER